MPVHLLWPDEYKKILTDAGCELAQEAIDDLEDNQLWRTEDDYHFFVPILGEDKLCASYKLMQILERVKRRIRA